MIYLMPYGRPAEPFNLLSESIQQFDDIIDLCVNNFFPRASCRSLKMLRFASITVSFTCLNRNYYQDRSTLPHVLLPRRCPRAVN